MKKKLLLAGLLISAAGMQAQQKATAEVSLTTGMTAKIELDDATDIATLTFTGPSDRWFALQIGSFATGGGMDDGEDVVWYNGTTLVDGNHNGSGMTPSTDGTNDWTVESNTVSGTTRTIVATRDFDTGSVDDYEFVYSDTSIDFAWAKNSSASYTMAGHGANRGYDLNNTYTCVAPDAPTASAQSFCATGGATVADLEATGEAVATFEWYANATGGSPLAANTVLNATTYHVSQTVGDCESARTPVVVTLTATPLPLSDDDTPEFCSSATIADLDVSGQPGATFSWYAEPDGGSPLASSTVLAAGDYYVSQTVDGCESNRLEFAVTFVTLASPTIADDTQEFCSEATVADLAATPMAGATLSWYADEEGGTALAANTVLVAGDYFVSQTLDGCVSDREEVTVTYVTIASPGVPSATPVVCDGTTLADLDVTLLEGADALWYAESDSTTPLASSTVVADGEDYFVEQMLGDCVSGRTGVTPTIGTLDAPDAPAAQTACENSLVSDLDAGAEEGATVTWYLTVGGEPVADDAEVTAASYFATQTLNGCESEASEVVVTVTPAPAEPSGVSPQEFEAGEAVNSLMIGIVVGADVTWYVMDGEGMQEIDGDDLLVDGTTYFVTQTIDGCESVPHAILAEAALGNESFNAASLVVYPNPVTDLLNISGKTELSGIAVVNLLGQTVLSQKVSGTTVTLNTGSLQNGTYILKVTSADGGSASMKIVK